MEKTLKIAIIVIVFVILVRIFAPFIVLGIIGLLIYLFATGKTKEFYSYVVGKIKSLFK